MMHAEPERFQRLIDVLIQRISDHLINQIASGADAVQIFDSWAGLFDHDHIIQFSLNPIVQIIRNVKSVYPDVPVVAFPRHIGNVFINFAHTPEIEWMSVDNSIPLSTIVRDIAPHCGVQGNLSNQLLCYGHVDNIVDKTRQILHDLGHFNFIFNLDHGVLPDTPVKHVQAVVDTVHRYTGA